MTTITLKINEKSSLGQIFLEFVKTFVAKKNGVEIVKIPNAETLKAIQEVENRKGIIKAKNATDLIKKLNS